ncbi:MAG: aldehyde dehydrogenase family protein, partial [Myxococcales bacterium]|nr:aldehyde dehydrogenase family protein [Myxococcales bacterium]
MATAPTRVPVKKTYKLYIGGAFPRSEGGHYLVVKDHKGAFVANVCRATRKDFRGAMVAARKAQAPWAARSAFNRGQILYRMAEMLEGRAAVFERLLAELHGYSASEAQAEVGAAVDRLVYYAGWCDKVTQVFGNTNPVASQHFNFSFIEPTGVVAAVAPKTAPLLGLVSVMAPLISIGNAAIVMVTPDNAVVAIELAEALATSDLPGGVVNLLTALWEDVGSYVSGHMDLDAFFGVGLSSEEQKAIQVSAA